jgi:oligoribonuclease
MPPSRENLVWIDLEMTGLEPDTCFIMEIASLVTDSELEIIAEGPSLVVHNSEAQLETLSEWSRDFFGRNGLIERVRASTVDVADAERQTLDFVREHTLPGVAPLCGNSVHHDRAFLLRHMPRLCEHLHYRIIDVSTIKELVDRWYPASEIAPPPKAESHQALADIRESVAELRYLRQVFFRPPEVSPDAKASR